jgi:DNA-binding NtrC family response regulator
LVLVDSRAGDALHFDVKAGDSERQRPTLLIVDDNRPLLKFLRAVISNEGWDIVAASSAEKALKEAESRTIDVALIDYMLPDLDGVTLSNKLRALMPDIRLVLMTGGGEMIFSRQSRLAQVPIIQKPFAKDDLLNLLRSQFQPQEASSASA